MYEGSSPSSLGGLYSKDSLPFTEIPRGRVCLQVQFKPAKTSLEAMAPHQNEITGGEITLRI